MMAETCNIHLKAQLELKQNLCCVEVMSVFI
jgi:hypothetical protein